MNTFFILQFCFLLFSSVYGLKQFPKLLPRCSMSDPQLSKCLIQASEDARQYVIKNEIPELLPKLTPFFIPEIKLQQGSQSVSFSASLKNVSLYGLEQYKYKDIEFKMMNEAMASTILKVEFPQIYIEGNYIVDGKILVTPLKGNGYFHANVSNIGFIANVILKLEKRNNFTYLIPQPSDYKATIGKVTDYGIEGLFKDSKVLANIGFIANVILKLEKRNNFTYLIPQPSDYKATIGKVTDYGIEGLFKDSKVLASAVQTVIKENLDILVEEVTPAIDEVVKQLLDEHVFKRVCRYPMEVLFTH